MGHYVGILRFIRKLFGVPARTSLRHYPVSSFPEARRIRPQPHAAAKPIPCQPNNSLPDWQQKISGRCWVVDGDTIIINRIQIRLAGIDAPELEHSYGRCAKSALIQLCQGQIISAVFDGTSSYSRQVATCFLPDGRDLSAEMVKQGMALDWRKFSQGRYRQFEPENIRQKLWLVDARQKKLMPQYDWPQDKVQVAKSGM
jgi:micrococcal nuclease